MRHCNAILVGGNAGDLGVLGLGKWLRRQQQQHDEQQQPKPDDELELAAVPPNGRWVKQHKSSPTNDHEEHVKPHQLPLVHVRLPWRPFRRVRRNCIVGFLARVGARHDEKFVWCGAPVRRINTQHTPLKLAIVVQAKK